jgi:hypothetical protein
MKKKPKTKKIPSKPSQATKPKKITDGEMGYM